MKGKLYMKGKRNWIIYVIIIIVGIFTLASCQAEVPAGTDARSLSACGPTDSWHEASLKANERMPGLRKCPHEERKQ